MLAPSILRSVGYRRAGESGKGGENVEHAGDRVAHSPGRNLPRPPGDRGNAHTAFQCAPLEASEWRIDRASRTAVVTGEDDQGAVGKTLLSHRIKDLSHAPVDLLDPVRVDPVWRLAGPLLTGIDWEVNRTVRQVEEEWFCLVGGNILDRLFGVHLDERLLVVR